MPRALHVGGPSSSLSPDADFASRASGPGVIAAWKLNNDDNSLQYINASYDGYVGGALDTSVSVLSGGSLRFTLPAGRAVDDISGNWNPPGRIAFGNTAGFGQYSTFYVQIMTCFSKTMYDNLNSGYWLDSSGNSTSWKIFDLFTWDNGGLTYDNIQITTVSGAIGGVAYMSAAATDCRTLTTSPDWPGSTSVTPYFVQSDWLDPLGMGSVNGLVTATSPYSEDPNGMGNIQSFPPAYQPSIPWPTNQWFTMDLKVRVGTVGANFGPNDSSLEIWQTPQNTTTRQKRVACRFPLLYNSPTSNSFNSIMLTPYMTGLSTSAPVNAYVWHTGLIISSQPIPLPTAYIPPPVLP